MLTADRHWNKANICLTLSLLHVTSKTHRWYALLQTLRKSTLCKYACQMIKMVQMTLPRFSDFQLVYERCTFSFNKILEKINMLLSDI
jgi:hypothetical protein